MKSKKVNAENYRQDWLLAGSALVLVAMLAGFFVWGIRTMTGDIDRSLRINTGGNSDVEVKIDQAKKILDARQ